MKYFISVSSFSESVPLHPPRGMRRTTFNPKKKPFLLQLALKSSTWFSSYPQLLKDGFSSSSLAPQKNNGVTSRRFFLDSFAFASPASGDPLVFPRWTLPPKSSALQGLDQQNGLTSKENINMPMRIYHTTEPTLQLEVPALLDPHGIALFRLISSYGMRSTRVRPWGVRTLRRALSDARI